MSGKLRRMDSAMLLTWCASFVKLTAITLLLLLAVSSAFVSVPVGSSFKETEFATFSSFIC